MSVFNDITASLLGALSGQQSSSQSPEPRPVSSLCQWGTGTTTRKQSMTSCNEEDFSKTTSGSPLQSGVKDSCPLAKKDTPELSLSPTTKKSTSLVDADPQVRKDTPIYSGVLAYFPDALAAVARVSKIGNDQHNPGSALHWDRSKSSDEYDACTRHLLDRAAGFEFDTDGQRQMAKAAWRALAALQKELEAEHEED